MDSAAAPVSLSAAKGGPVSPPVSLLIRAPLSFEENDSPLASDTSEEEEDQEGFETASDPEDGSFGSALPAAAPKVGVLPRSSSMPIKAQLTRDDDPDGEVFVEELEDEDVDDEDDGFYGVARVPVSSQVPALMDKGGVLEGEQGDATPSKAFVLPAEGGDSRSDSLEKVSGEDSKTEDSVRDVNLGAEEKETVENPAPRITEEKPIQDRAAVSGTMDADEERAVPVSQQEKDGNLVEELGGTTSPATGAVDDSKRVEDKSEAVEVEKDGETDGSSSKEVSLTVEETGDEKLTIEQDPTASESEVNNDELVPDSDNSISSQDSQSPFITAEESNSREIEKGKLGISGVTEDGTAPLPNSVSEPELTKGDNLADYEEKSEEEEKNLASDGSARVAMVASSEAAKEMMKELGEGFSSTSPSSALDSSENIDGQIILDSDEEMVTDDEDEGKEMIDPDALVALLKAAASGSTADGSGGVISQGSSRIFSVDRPAGLGSSIPSLKPAPPRPAGSNLLSPSQLPVVAEPDNNMTEEQKKLHEKVELIRVKFLRLVYRLGHSPEETVVAQVLYRLSLAEGIHSGRQIGRTFSLESAKKKASQLEQDGTEDLDFSCNILVLGKSGVGKSATLNSIFGEEKSQTSAFISATSSVKEIVGTVDGVKIRVIDTPGLRASGTDQASSRRILTSIKKYMKRCPPDIVLYVDRMDALTRDQNDLPLLRTITSTLGSSIWLNAIVALTHASSAPPDGSSGSSLSYEVFVAQRSHAVQQSIRLAAGDMRLMNPVALVENHPSCRRNREGQRVLPNGVAWRSQMLLLCCSSKILSEANSLLKLHDTSSRKLFGFRFHSPPLPFLLSSLLQSREHPKLSTDQGGENGDSDMDLDDLSDADQGEEDDDEYDHLPPFKPLKKSQIAKLTKEQRRAYFEEYDYRVKLLQKKQWMEELRRLKELKNRQKVSQDDFGHADMGEDFDGPATVPVPLPDMVLPPSFDCDVPTYRYRFLEPTSQFLARPVLDTHGWDHDCGYDGVSLEESLAVAGQFPAVITAQVTKDKKEFSVHLETSIAAKHGENGSTLAGFDIQAVGKQLAYILRGETKLKTLKKNRTTGGISMTFLGETVATGLKLEDQFYIGKRVKLVASTGAVRAQDNTAYGANLEAQLHDKDYPIGQALTTFGLSLISAHGNLALGANLQSQFSIGRNSKMAVRVGLNNKQTGQITVRTSTSEQLQIALVGIIPIAISIFRSMRPGDSSTY